MDIRLNKDTVSVSQRDGLKVLSFRDRTTGEEGEVAAEEILVAPGIRPMTELLHLENTDVRWTSAATSKRTNSWKRRLRISGP